jgi:hypothetical protein
MMRNRHPLHIESPPLRAACALEAEAKSGQLTELRKYDRQQNQDSRPMARRGAMSIHLRLLGGSIPRTLGFTKPEPIAAQCAFCPGVAGSTSLSGRWACSRLHRSTSRRWSREPQVPY